MYMGDYWSVPSHPPPEIEQITYPKGDLGSPNVPQDDAGGLLKQP